jgi:predicted nucleotidyltransferase
MSTGAGVPHPGVGYGDEMPAVQSTDLLDALKVVAATLRETKVPFALAGGLAAWAHGGPPTEHDIDLMIREADAEAALAALREAGLRVEAPPEGWLVKAWVDDVLIDLIFAPKGITVDDEFLERCEEISVAAVDMHVISLEDLLVGKLLALTEHNLDFGPPLEWARAIREQVDWRTVADRTFESPFARTFLAMLEELGILDVAVVPR